MAKKLIEVALPLEEINKASAREKSIRHGHPSTLHLWWARRPLAAARAVIFSSLITDPGDPEYPWRDGQERDIEKERGRLHQLIIDLVQWENSTNDRILGMARDEIMRHTDGNPPSLLDPFAGGGAIPLEGQRLGLEAHASDLNPVAVLINKAMIEIPPMFAGQAPVNPDQQGRTGIDATWKGATGLAEDVRYYGMWMRDEAQRRIGHLYPKVTLPKGQGGGTATVIAWLWARTVTCPNPACGAEMPLVRTFTLSTKKGNEAYVVPHVRADGSGVDFEVLQGKSNESGTMDRKGARCLVCQTAVPFSRIRSEGQRVGLGHQMMAIVAEGNRGRAYLSASPEQTTIANNAQSTWSPTAVLPDNPRDVRPQLYGLSTFGELFTQRQLVALTSLSELITHARDLVLSDAALNRRSNDDGPLAEGGCGPSAYADAVATYLAFAVDRLTDYSSSLCSWHSSKELIRNTFGRQALPMTWDYAEVNVMSGSAGNFGGAVEWIAKVLDNLPANLQGVAIQADARNVHHPGLVSTDPPYYDNISYADLSDFFYVWLKRSLSDIWPGLFRSLLVPKSEELVASPSRFEGGQVEADDFFESGLRETFLAMASIQDTRFPMTVYYAYKQAETEIRGGRQSETASTGWQTMLEGMVTSGFQINGTWPMNTEMANRMVASGTNALASSIVLACRVRPSGAPEATRQQFLREMRSRLAEDLRPLQHANIAPSDLPQAAIGPGMAIYSKYSRVREASGDSLRVREALALINQVLDEVLAEQDEEYDTATRWAISWYEEFGMNEGPFGKADNIARARNVAVDDLAHDGMVQSGRGKVRFRWREEYATLPPDWNPRSEDVSDWMIMQRLAHAVQSGQEQAAAIKARIDATLPGRSDLARDLAYRAYNIAERKGWTREALVYNTLVQNWAGAEQLASEMAPADVEQQLTLNL